MAMGYCLGKDCDKLVHLRQGGYKHAGGRERFYYPLDHAKPNGERCVDGPKKGI